MRTAEVLYESANTQPPKTTELLEEAYLTTKELAPVEYELAKVEWQANLKRLRLSAVLGASSVVFATLALSALVCLVVVSASSPVATALWLLLGFFLISGILLLSAVKAFPGFLKDTRRRLRAQARKLKEHLS